MGRFEIEFPCGLIIDANSKFNYFGVDEWNELYEKGCPIHGKKCK
jgi:hypothetical protein